MRENRIMLFDLYAGGHHGQYIQQLVSYWGRCGISGRLDIVVPEPFTTVHQALTPLLDRYHSRGLNLVPISNMPPLDTTGISGLIRADIEHGRLLRRYVERLKPDHCIILYFDHAQLSLSFGLRFDYPLRISGIYFRPSFHYTTLSSRRPDLRQRLLDLRKRFLLHTALRNPHFDTLFCLDPLAIPHIRTPQPTTRAVSLPDGIELSDTIAPREAIRKQLGVEPDRKLLLLFGSLAPRKGIFQTIDALIALSHDTARKTCLALVGSVLEVDKAPLRDRIAHAVSKCPLQIVLHDEFVPESSIQGYFHAADLALAPYQHHIGSSGILVRAADAEIPVLGSDYGMMGFLIRNRKLGYAVDTANPQTIAAALQHYLNNSTEVPFSKLNAREFATENTADAMAATIFRHLGIQEQKYA